MEKIKALSVGFLFSLFALVAYPQNPDYVDPGNVRGDEGTAYLWENPEYYVPVMVVIIIVVAIGIMRKKKSDP